MNENLQQEMVRFLNDFVRDYSRAKENFSVKIVQEKWLDHPDYRDTLHKRIGNSDLAAIYYVTLPGGGFNTSVRITQKILDDWGITFEEMEKDVYASEGMQPGFMPIDDAISMLLAPSTGAESSSERFLIVSTTRSFFMGAGVIATSGWFEKASSVMGGSFWLIPSSIHEVLLLPDCDVNIENMASLIQSVNSQTVQEQDRLSDRPYYYDAENGTFTRK